MSTVVDAYLLILGEWHFFISIYCVQVMGSCRMNDYISDAFQLLHPVHLDLLYTNCQFYSSGCSLIFILGSLRCLEISLVLVALSFPCEKLGIVLVLSCPVGLILHEGETLIDVFIPPGKHCKGLISFRVKVNSSRWWQEIRGLTFRFFPRCCVRPSQPCA